MNITQFYNARIGARAGQAGFRHKFIVAEGQAGLVYRHGVFVRQISAGRHVIWGFGWTVNTVDLRKTSAVVPGQEVLTSDSVGLKLSLLMTYQVADPAKAAQIALRAVAGGMTIETLLGQRLDVAAQLLARVQPDVAKVGLTVTAIEVKDVTLPNDLKRAFSDVLKARQEGQAALERARGESASLRSLANAARVLEGNPALQNLRLMQSLTAAQHAGNTLVLGLPGFMPLKNGKPGSPEHKPDDGSS